MLYYSRTICSPQMSCIEEDNAVFSNRLDAIKTKYGPVLTYRQGLLFSNDLYKHDISRHPSPSSPLNEACQAVAEYG
jgi:hypothetical protein